MSRKASPALRAAREEIAKLQAQLNEYIAIVGGYPDGDLIIRQQEQIFVLEAADVRNTKSLENLQTELAQTKQALKEVVDAEIARREAANAPRRRNAPTVELVEARLVDDSKIGVDGVIYKLDGKVFRRPAGGFQGFANGKRIMTDEAGKTMLPRTLIATLAHA